MVMFRLGFILTLFASPTMALSADGEQGQAIPSVESTLRQIESAQQKGQEDVRLAQRTAESLSRIVGVGISPSFAIATFGMVDWYNGRTEKLSLIHI